MVWEPTPARTVHRALIPTLSFLLFSTPVRGEAPRTLSISPAVLEESAIRLKSGDADLLPSLRELRSGADKALKQKPLSVVQKTLRAASGDVHDYFSFGIYWWPDPAKPDGLPYIQRDGERNPASREGNDATPFSQTNQTVATLGLAYYFTGDERYAAKAAEVTRVWYLDPATRMNPNMNYAQAIPGKTDGRGIGIIEATGITDFMDAIALIGPSAAWTDSDEQALRAWLGDFYHWLRTSKNGLDQENAKNNHGVYYDAIATHLALFLGKDAEAKARLEKALVRRLDAQIASDGRQPHELARTLSFSYSVFNLEAFFQLAELGNRTGIDWWSHRGPDGQSLKAALAVMLPYADPEKPWDLGKQIKTPDRRTILPFLRQALRREGNPAYEEALGRFGKTDPAGRWRLIR